jgi:hypothetical protein
VNNRFLRIIIIAFAVLGLVSSGQAQKKRRATKETKSDINDRVAQAKNEMIVAAKNYKASLEKVLALQEAEVKSDAEVVEKRKALLQQGIVSKREVEDSERVLDAAQAKVNQTKRQMSESDELIAEAAAAEQLARLPAPRAGSYVSTAALIRYSGSNWALTDISKVENFFDAKFKHALPISAFGQTAVHTHLGFDHANSVDVAVHPDSAEGEALMAYLRSMSIPFIAFRSAVPGSATGAHIHIGYPSHRLAR